MDADVQAFVDKWAEKSAAKAVTLAALGAAKQADYKASVAETPEARARWEAKSAEQWAIVESSGINGGEEGRLYDEAFALAEAYVAAHPEQFASFSAYDFDLVHAIATAFKLQGRKEEAAKITMFELVTFERQHIGQAVKVEKRVR